MDFATTVTGAVAGMGGELATVGAAGIGRSGAAGVGSGSRLRRSNRKATTPTASSSAICAASLARAGSCSTRL